MTYSDNVSVGDSDRELVITIDVDRFAEELAAAGYVKTRAARSLGTDALDELAALVKWTEADSRIGGELRSLVEALRGTGGPVAVLVYQPLPLARLMPAGWPRRDRAAAAVFELVTAGLVDATGSTTGAAGRDGVRVRVTRGVVDDPADASDLARVLYTALVTAHAAGQPYLTLAELAPDGDG